MYGERSSVHEQVNIVEEAPSALSVLYSREVYVNPVRDDVRRVTVVRSRELAWLQEVTI